MYIFTISINNEEKGIVKYDDLNTAIKYLIHYIRSGYDAEVISALTGEVLVSVEKDRIPYVADSIRYML